MANSKNCRSNEKGRILGIKNRTENWKTARYLSPFFDDGAIHLANRLMEGCTGGSENTCKGPVRLELYWKGMRDYINCKKPKPTCYDLADHYSKYFSCLREKIKKFNESKQFKHILRLPKEANNYTVAKVEDKKSLYNNLRHTEIDIVLETPDYLFIGEAKDESDFGANGKLVLVHQLIRQYVMASILVKGCLGKCDKEVIPFIVGKCTEDLKKKTQVCFMKKHYGLKDENILGWEEISRLGT